jgi:hypothetical protein
LGGPGPRAVSGHNAGYEKGESGDSEASARSAVSGVGCGRLRVWDGREGAGERQGVAAVWFVGVLPRRPARVVSKARDRIRPR